MGVCVGVGEGWVLISPHIKLVMSISGNLLCAVISPHLMRYDAFTTSTIRPYLKRRKPSDQDTNEQSHTNSDMQTHTCTHAHTHAYAHENANAHANLHANAHPRVHTHAHES